MPRSGSGRDMGLGRIADPDIVVKRKFRWTFELISPCGGVSIPENFVKSASRPNLSIEETQIDFLHGRMWLPGKATWEPITVTYYDVGGGGGSDILTLFSWLATIYNFTDPVGLHMSSVKGQNVGGGGTSGSGGYAGLARINMYDGCGKAMEQWQLGNVWPQAVNFGDLAYEDSGEVTIELTLRYSDVQYTNYCPGGQLNVCCRGC